MVQHQFTEKLLLKILRKLTRRAKLFAQIIECLHAKDSAQIICFGD